MAGNSNDLEVKLRFLTEHLDSIDQGVKQLEGLKKEALSLGSVLKTTLSVETINASLHKVVELFGEVKESIKMGAELENLSARTGQSVSDLVTLQQAFKNAGIGSESVGMVLNKLQKALGGVNEEGGDTTSVFARLGLSFEDLKSMSATQQIEALQKAFSSLPNQADRAKAAMEMFGRGGGQMLAILSKADSLDIAKQQVGSLGETMEKNAEKFHKLEDSWNAIGLRMQQLFAGVAEEVAPLLQHIADEANKIDLTKVGKEVGDLILGLTELVKIAAPVAAVLGTQFLLEATLARISAFTNGIAKSATALSAETLALQSNTVAQAANAAARSTPGVGSPIATGAAGAAFGTPGALRPFAPGFETVGGEIKTAGAPFSKDAYDSARKTGMTAEAALAEARQAMKTAVIDGEKYLKESALAAEKAVPAWKRLAGGISEVSGKVGTFVGALGSIQGMFAAMAAEQAVQAASNAVGNYAAGNIIGERTNSADMSASERLLDEKNKQQGDLADRVKNVSTQEEKKALADEISAIIEKDAAQARDKGTAANPRGAQNQVLEQSNQTLTRLANILAGKSGLQTDAQADLDRVAAESRARAIAQQKGDADLKGQLSQNQKEADFAALPTNKKLDSVEAQETALKTQTHQGTEEEQKAASEKIVELDKQRIALAKELADWTKGEADKKKDEAKAAAETTAELQQHVQIEAARAAGHVALASAMEKEFALQKETAGLREKGADEETVSKYESLKRSQYQQENEQKSKSLDDETSLVEAKAKGDDKEVKKLEWLKEYNRLKAEGYREDQAQRAANAASADGPKPADGTKPGEVDPVSGTRRGRDQSDTQWGMKKADDNMGGPGGSLLDAYKANRNLAPDTVGGKSILPDHPTSNNGAPGGGQPGAQPGGAPEGGHPDSQANGGAGALEKSAASLEKSSADINKAGDKTPAALAKLADAVGKVGAGLTGLKSKTDDNASKIEDLAAQVEALSNKV